MILIIKIEESYIIVIKAHSYEKQCFRSREDFISIFIKMETLKCLDCDV